MSDRQPESQGLELSEVPMVLTLITGELDPLDLSQVDSGALDEVLIIALGELVQHGEETLPAEILQRIA